MLPGLKTYYKATVIKWGVTGTGRSESNTGVHKQTHTHVVNWLSRRVRDHLTERTKDGAKVLAAT